MNRSHTACPNCRSNDLVSVGMTLPKGPVLFAHCRACEHRWWTDAEEVATLTLPDVLERAAA